MKTVEVYVLTYSNFRRRQIPHTFKPQRCSFFGPANAPSSTKNLSKNLTPEKTNNPSNLFNSKKTLYLSVEKGADMTEPKGGRPIFFPKNLVLFGNLTLFLWIVLDSIVFLLYDFTAGFVFFILTLILIYGVLNILGCLRPCYNCIKCTHGMGRLAALYFGRRIFKDYKYNYKLPTAILFTLYIGAFPAAFALYSTIIDFTTIKVALLAVLLLFTSYSALTWRPRKPKTPKEQAQPQHPQTAIS